MQCKLLKIGLWTGTSLYKDTNGGTVHETIQLANIKISNFYDITA